MWAPLVEVGAQGEWESDRGEVPGDGKSPGEVTGVTVMRQRALT